MSGKDKWVRRFSVDETARHKNGFTIYKITSVLFPLSSPVAGTSVSVWKRFSDAQRLRRSMRALHQGLGLPGRCPALPNTSFFRRFEPQVLQERCKAIQELLEFVAEHRLLFASTEFVHFLQSGYSAPPRPSPRGVINEIRTSLRLPLEDAAPIEYQTDEHCLDTSGLGDSTRDTPDGGTSATIDNGRPTTDNTDRQTIHVSDIEIFGAADVEMPTSPTDSKNTDSSESLSSLDSIKSDLFEEVSRMTIDKPRSCVKKRTVLPDLINFDAPSTSRCDDGNTRSSADTDSLNSSYYDDTESKRSLSRSSHATATGPGSMSGGTGSMSDSYIFEAGYLLQQAARCEQCGDYATAFQRYKEGIEKMLVGVHTDSDPHRRALIKDKSDKYLTHAEAIYNEHIVDKDDSMSPPALPRAALLSPPARLLQRDYAELALYRVLNVIQGRLMLVLHARDRTKHVIKVIQKIPNNLTEFDEIFPRQTRDTKQPILPTNIPYMINLDSYIETPNLVFLVLQYAPGQKLFEYIKNYVNSTPSTPARELNLENVFVDPLKAKNDGLKTDQTKDSIKSIDNKVESKNNNVEEEVVDKKTDSLHSSEISVNELVINSQRLLLNLNKVLNEQPNVSQNVLEKDGDIVGYGGDKDSAQTQPVDKEEGVNVRQKKEVNKIVEISSLGRGSSLPPSAVRRWAAQILLAVDSLHNCGIVCRDLNPSNILLGRHGQALLTYFIGYNPAPPLRSDRPHSCYIAPELYHTWLLPAEGLDCVCDYWSYGAVLYLLICGVPLQYYHRGPFTSHTVLQLPAGLPLEATSILTQLLCFSPRDRLGANGVEEIKSHPYFKSIDWPMVYDHWLTPD